jgi:glyoxylase-like metal-dependent hydrolase (beta-lactamase superfamily II)
VEFAVNPCVQTFFDPSTATATHVVHDGPGSSAAIIDSVLDFDIRSGRTSRASADQVARFVADQRLQVAWHLETHVHADHLSAAPYLQSLLGGRIGIGARVVEIQQCFGKMFNFGLDGSDAAFDRLFEDGDVFSIGTMQARVMAAPGHTPADVAYVIGDAAFVGDTLFAPDLGSARADFPGGCARELYRSAQKILALPPETRLFLCHDYPPEGRGPRWETTVAEERAQNKHLRDGIDEEAFVQMRTARDATLSLPALMLPSVQVNMRAGQLPPKDSNGIAYIRIPIDTV